MSSRRRVSLRKHRPVPSRRRFLIQAGACLASAGGLFAGRGRGGTLRAQFEGPPLRPPSALADERAFQAACLRCGLCGTVCENGCIRFFGLTETEWGALTPALDPRRRSCTLCMRCTQICPTGALSPVEDDRRSIAEKVRMGRAEVDPDLCISYLGRVCGVCHDACPYPGEAIRLIPPATPVILEEGCVGCGRCVELCPQTPSALRVLPRSALS